jgi:hypothetical protein
VWIICWYHPPFGWYHLILQFNGQKPKSGGGPNQPQYKTITEIWYNRTNLTAWQTYTPLADGPGNGQRSFFFHLLEFTVIINCIILASHVSKLSPTDYSDWQWSGPKDVSDPDHKTRQTSPLHQPNKNSTQYTTNSGFWKRRELCAMHVLLKTKEQVWNSSVQNATGGCVPAHVSRYITPNCISENHLTLSRKSGAHRHE